MTCRWCERSDTGLCYRHWELRREQAERRARLYVLLTPIAATALAVAWLVLR